MTMLNRAAKPEHMQVLGVQAHRLHGRYEGFWAVTVSRNWRIVYRFEQGHVTDVDYLDYH